MKIKPTATTSLYCGRWRKVSKSCRDLDLNQTMSNLSELFSYTTVQYVQVSSGLNHYFLVIVYTDTHIDRQKDRGTDTQKEDTSTL